LFVYYNQRVHERVEQQQRVAQEKAVTEAREAAKTAKRAVTVGSISEVTPRDKQEDNQASTEVTPVIDDTTSAGITELGIIAPQVSPTPNTTPTPSPEVVASSRAMNSIFGSLFNAASAWPDALAGALSFDGDDLVARVILLNRNGTQSAPIPFLSFLVTGPPIAGRAASLAPADTDIFVSASLDLPRMYDAAISPANAKPGDEGTIRTSSSMRVLEPGEKGEDQGEPALSPAKQMALLEVFLGFRIKEDLVSSFGNEVAIAVRMHPRITKGEDGRIKVQTRKPNYALMISLQNRDAAQRMLPKLLEVFGMKAAGTGATERYNETEITNYTSFALAFVDDFLLLAADNEGVKEVLEARANQQVLAGSPKFRDSVAWQPLQRTAQAYVSQDFADNSFTQGTRVFDYAGDPGKAFVARFRAEPRPVSFSLSSDGGTQQHELHVPQSLILNLLGQFSIASKYSEIISNETMATYTLMHIANAEKIYKADKGQGHYGTLDDLTKANLMSDYFQQFKQYKFELTISGESFEGTATPIEYGAKARHSFFIDDTETLRGGDLGGRRATVSDSVMTDATASRTVFGLRP
jgi:hypothetical protein